jgi:small subunit ribosomal protein S16
MLKIRLQRVGRKNNPSFRFVVTDSKNSTKSGKFLEVLGSFDYRKDGTDKIDADRLKHWISKGAKPTDNVHNYLVGKKIISGKKINILPRKSPPKPAEDPKAAEAAKVATPAPEAAVAATPVEAPQA